MCTCPVLHPCLHLSPWKQDVPEQKRVCRPSGSRPSPCTVDVHGTAHVCRELFSLQGDPSQLQALSIPGPATMLYCLFPSAGRCKCSTCGCPELRLLASEMRDLSPLDSWAGFGKQACWGISAFCSHFSLPNSLFLPPTSPVLFSSLPDFPVRGGWSAVSPEGHFGGRRGRVKWVCLQPPPATQLAVGLDVVFFHTFLLIFPRDGYHWLANLTR